MVPVGNIRTECESFGVRQLALRERGKRRTVCVGEMVHSTVLEVTDHWPGADECVISPFSPAYLHTGIGQESRMVMVNSIVMALSKQPLRANTIIQRETRESASAK